MVELIITDSKHVDVRSASDYTLDCAWGKEENDFELVLSGASTIDAGAYIYIDGSECGGVVDAMEDQLTAGVSTLPKYFTTSGISFPLGNTRKGNTLVAKVVSATARMIRKEVIASTGISLPPPFPDGFSPQTAEM